MIIGDPTRFAVEVEQCPHTHGPYLDIHFCYWVGNERIGELQACSEAGIVYDDLRYPVEDCGNRDGERFCHLSGAEAFDLLHNGLFESEETLRQLVDDERWGRLNVSVHGNGFHCRLYLFDCGNIARLLVGHVRPQDNHFPLRKEQRLSRGEFDVIVQDFRTWIENLLVEKQQANSDSG